LSTSSPTRNILAAAGSPNQVAKMMSFKRAIVFAAFFITAFYLLRQSHTSNDPEPFVQPPAKPNNADSSLPKDTTEDPIAGSVVSGETASHRGPPPQQTLQDLSKMSLYDKLAYQYPYDVETKFPAYIWQTWKWTPANAEFTFRDQEASWTELHPGFVHEVITDKVAVSLLRLLYASVPEVLEAYDAMPEPVLKADFFRYLILFARGGIYSDIDTVALKSALDWIPDAVPRSSIGLVIGIEADPDRPDWKDWYSRRIQFCQWTIQSKSGHPVLRDIVTRITQETLKRKKEGTYISKEKSVMEFTGPAVWTDTIFDYFNDPRYFNMEKSTGNITYQNFTGIETPKKVGDVVVLPITSFSPGVQQMGAKDYDDPMAFVKHDFEGNTFSTD
jgi:alpha 1,6-mannosyltransferase